jgi:hypothetical protein
MNDALRRIRQAYCRTSTTAAESRGNGKRPYSQSFLVAIRLLPMEQPAASPKSVAGAPQEHSLRPQDRPPLRGANHSHSISTQYANRTETRLFHSGPLRENFSDTKSISGLALSCHDARNLVSGKNAEAGHDRVEAWNPLESHQLLDPTTIRQLCDQRAEYSQIRAGRGGQRGSGGSGVPMYLWRAETREMWAGGKSDLAQQTWPTHSSPTHELSVLDWKSKMAVVDQTRKYVAVYLQQSSIQRKSRLYFGAKEGVSCTYIVTYIVKMTPEASEKPPHGWLWASGSPVLARPRVLSSSRLSTRATLAAHISSQQFYPVSLLSICTGQVYTSAAASLSLPTTTFNFSVNVPHTARPSAPSKSSLSESTRW